jgi:hypothetical protein
VKAWQSSEIKQKHWLQGKDVAGQTVKTFPAEMLATNSPSASAGLWYCSIGLFEQAYFTIYSVVVAILAHKF